MKPRELRKPFSSAVDMFRELNDMSHSLVMSSLQLSEQQQLACVSCPACFGPQPPNANQYPTATRDSLILCLDGNFQHRHHAKASRDEAIRSHHFFIQPNEVENMKAEIRIKEMENKPPAQVCWFTRLLVVNYFSFVPLCRNCMFSRPIAVLTHTKQPMINETNQRGRDVTTLD
jgi:hypothetical protein